jgi:foldase protein PrsA
VKYLFFITLTTILTACSINAAQITPTVSTLDATTASPPPEIASTPSPNQPESVPTTVEEELIGNKNIVAYENGRPLAARVNREPIFLDDYVKQVGQLQQALTTDNSEPAPETVAQIRQQVFNTLIDQAIIEQEAARAGIVVTEETVDAKIQEGITQGGGEAQFEAWLAANNLTITEFREQLHSELIANQVFETITGDIPATADQIELSQILVADDSSAWSIIEQLKQGADFAELVQTHSIDESSRENNGNLGWFPQGLGLVPAEVEAIAFSIEPGQVSGPIQSPLGFHIIKLENREANRSLDDVRQVLKQQIFTKWLAEQRSSTMVEIYVEF